MKETPRQPEAGTQLIGHPFSVRLSGPVWGPGAIGADAPGQVS